MAGLAPVHIDNDLVEWDYGDLEGLTTTEIQQPYPGWSIWDGPWPGGESAAAVAARADRLIERITGSGASRVALVGHGHFSRVLAARWVGQTVRRPDGCFSIPRTWSELGWLRGEECPALERPATNRLNDGGGRPGQLWAQ